MLRRILPAVVLVLFCGSALAEVPKITPGEYQARRDRLAKSIGPDGVFIALPAPWANRNGDVDWPYRQTNDLLYLTGLNSPDVTLVLLPGEKEHREILFVPDRDPRREPWTGKIASHEEVTAVTGVKEVVSAKWFDQFLVSLLDGRAWGESEEYGYYRAPGMPQFLQAVRGGRAEVWLLLGERGGKETETQEQKLAAKLRGQYPELRFRNASPLVEAARQVKSAGELAILQHAIDATAEAQKVAMRRVLTAKAENEVQAAIESTFRSMGACCWAFPSIVAAAENTTTLHYEENEAAIVRDKMLLTDLGAETAGYAADVTRTYPADGTFSDDQRAIYEAVLAAQNESIALMTPGHTYVDVQGKAQEVIGRELLKLGLVTKNEPAQARMYFIHGVGHPIGLDTHDTLDPVRKFEPGMVLTDEPGIYVRRDDVLAHPVFLKLTPEEQASIRKALDRYAGIGVRIEDDVLVTEGAPKILSAGAPRSVADIEKWMAGGESR